MVPLAFLARVDLPKIMLEAGNGLTGHRPSVNNNKGLPVMTES